MTKTDQIKRFLKLNKMTELDLSLILNKTFTELRYKFDNDMFSEPELKKLENLGCKFV